MPAKTDADYLRDMLMYAEEAQKLVSGRSRDELASDATFRYAVQYCILIIGEAASHVSEAGRQRAAAIPWREIIGMRNWLVHGYAAVREETLWETAAHDLATLAEEILNVLPPEQT